MYNLRSSEPSRNKKPLRMSHEDAQYDVIVIGGGHAGTESAYAAARMGAKTLLLTQNIETIGQMSCNPAIGGIGKGHLVREIDALGGLMARAADAAGIHFRVLNRRKGPAVRATRAQADRALYKAFVLKSLENQQNLSIFQQSVHDLIIENGVVLGVETQLGLRFYAPSVVLTVGTFLGGKIHVGLKQSQGGRAGDAPSNALAERLRALPFNVARLKTGTPPRIDGKSINYSELEPQWGDEERPVFSFMGSLEDHPEQVACHITRTNAETHDIIRAHLDESPMYSGVIEGVGPRYCPSIEDKVMRFAERDSHQLFIEPEGLNTYEVYPNGISTSLPYQAQLKFVRSIKGFERAHITRPGYAIEYDFFDPRSLKPSLETKPVKGLFFAGQINGTTGYEEAASQGLLAGVNAVLNGRREEPWWLQRDEAYLGVLVDDLITNGTQEPYRMFTSRAEHRLILREDNADLRLTEKGRKLGLVDEQRWASFCEKQEAIETGLAQLKKSWLHPGSVQDHALKQLTGEPLSHEQNAYDILKRPGIGYLEVCLVAGLQTRFEKNVVEQIEIQTKYEGYIKRQKQEVERLRQQESTLLPDNMDYASVKGLSNEVRQKLIQVKPSSIGQAGRIPGMTPAAKSLLLIHLKKQGMLVQDGLIV